MKFLISAVLLVFSCGATAQKEVPLAELKAHVGDTVTTCGVVSNAYYAIKAKNSPTFLNIGGKYPNQFLTVVIWEDARSKFNFKPEETLLKKHVCITGKVVLFDNKPQITIYTPIQIQISKLVNE